MNIHLNDGIPSYLNEISSINGNVKLLLRHAERPSLKNEPFPDKVNLTEKGIKDAIALGQSIYDILGVVYSSPITRCVQTASLIASSSDVSTLKTSDILGYSFIDNEDDASKKFACLNLKQIVLEILLNSKVKGFVPKTTGIKNILDFLFMTGGYNNTIDVYCTHDMHISILDGFMMNSYQSISEISLDWPNMLEGMLLFGHRADFYCIWRGQQKRFKNFLV